MVSFFDTGVGVGTVVPGSPLESEGGSGSMVFHGGYESFGPSQSLSTPA